MGDTDPPRIEEGGVMADAKVIHLFKQEDPERAPTHDDDAKNEAGLIVALTEEMEDSLWDVTNRIQALWECDTRTEFVQQVREIQGIVSRWSDA